MATKKKPVKNTAFAKRILRIVDGSFLTRDYMMDNIPFLLFLFALAIFYIGNSHYAEKCVISSNNLNRELKDLHSDYITSHSDLMFVSKQSEVAKAVAPMGIHESVVPPKKIVVKKDESPDL